MSLYLVPFKRAGISARLFTYCNIIFFITLAACQDTSKSNTDLSSPESSIAGFELEPGFKIELVAAEPLLSDPVDMEIDEYGRLYVVEMHGYPLDKTGTGKIRLLSDTNHDGRMDKTTLFADSLLLPTSVMRWKKGILVTDAPNVLYLEDADGDGAAEIRDTLLTGFALSNPQHNLNTPLLGIDNWIYLGHEGAVSTKTYMKEFGDEGRDIFFPSQPGNPRLPPNASGRAVRFKPDSRQLEMTSSYTQFGHSFDAWGNHLLVSNANHIYMETIGEPYLKRNRELLISNATENLSDHLGASEVFPITINPQNQLLTDVGVITSACGITAYTGGAFPEGYQNVSFVAEPVSNLVHADQLTPKGTVFTASRLRPNKEFLASKDAWFRPVNMYVGPDGALYVVDYYRQIIEHPEWMGEEVVKSGQLYNGMDKGRIYRISAEDSAPAEWTKGLKLGDAPDEELVKYLANKNQWWRMNAQRLLIDRGHREIIPALEQMAGRSEVALGRLHALWTLEGLGALKAGIIEHALTDPEAGIREHAIRLAELKLRTMPSLIPVLYALHNDDSQRVRYQLLCTLGFIETEEASAIRNKLLFRDMNDKWVQIAALSANTSQAASLLDVMLDSFRTDVAAHASFVQRLATMIGSRGTTATIEKLIMHSMKASHGEEADQSWRVPLFEGLAAGLRRNKSFALTAATQKALVDASFGYTSPKGREAAFRVLAAAGPTNAILLTKGANRALLIAEDTAANENDRVLAIGFLALQNPVQHIAKLKGFIDPREPLPVQLAALSALSKVPGQQPCEYLLSQWSSLTPELRDAGINTFLESGARIGLLLDAVETGKISADEIGWGRRVELMAQDDFTLRNRARALFARDEKEREKVNAEFQAALKLRGVPEKGRTVFQENCALCHQVRGKIGITFGPDLGSIHNWSQEAIMANILSPNLSISSGYDLWSVELKNGEKAQGIIASETPSAITLKNTGKLDRIIDRREILSLKALQMSAMTGGFEKQINHQQMADLLAFLKQN